MGDSYGDPQTRRSFNNSRESGRGNFRGGRGPNNRDQGGFRIRLSDNEMNAARTIQEAFNLRSTVSVLGFSIRTLAQILEDGNVEDLLKKYGAQAQQAGNTNAGKGRFDNRTNDRNFTSPVKANPFARPSKPESLETKSEEARELLDNDEKPINDLAKSEGSLTKDESEGEEAKESNED